MRENARRRTKATLVAAKVRYELRACVNIRLESETPMRTRHDVQIGHVTSRCPVGRSRRDPFRLYERARATRSAEKLKARCFKTAQFALARACIPATRKVDFGFSHLVRHGFARCAARNESVRSTCSALCCFSEPRRDESCRSYSQGRRLLACCPPPSGYLRREFPSAFGRPGRRETP